jgi:8-oxo-dGTP pyrophosphatase MutT (NUDIX family)
MQALRIKSRALAPLDAGGAINAFQWCKARLLKSHGDGLVSVMRMEADSKFFRSFSIVVIMLMFVYHEKHQFLIGFSLLLLTLWRYIEQRFKSTQQAYWSVITLESMRKEPRPETKAERGVLTHSGGVVYAIRPTGSIEYLLVQANKNREWVLPKGHIEPGEKPRETAVREVSEETSQYARVVDWIEDVPFVVTGRELLVRFFLMEFVSDESKKGTNPEDRQHQWLELNEAKEATSKFAETDRLLTEADLKIRRLMEKKRT